MVLSRPVPILRHFFPAYPKTFSPTCMFNELKNGMSTSECHLKLNVVSETIETSLICIYVNITIQCRLSYLMIHLIY